MKEQKAPQTNKNSTRTPKATAFISNRFAVQSKTPEERSEKGSSLLENYLQRRQIVNLDNSGSDYSGLLRAASAIQRQLTLGEPEDRFEREADRVAGHVVAEISQFPRPLDRPQELELGTQRRRSAKTGQNTSTEQLVEPQVEREIRSAQGQGESLPEGLQRNMGRALGVDLKDVKIHNNSQADELNTRLDAKAFTTGKDIFFRAGAYKPHSRDGHELIAHELTHVLQQGKGETLQRGSHGKTLYADVTGNYTKDEEEHDCSATKVVLQKNVTTHNPHTDYTASAIAALKKLKYIPKDVPNTDVNIVVTTYTKKS